MKKIIFLALLAWLLIPIGVVADVFLELYETRGPVCYESGKLRFYVRNLGEDHYYLNQLYVRATDQKTNEIIGITGDWDLVYSDNLKPGGGNYAVYSSEISSLVNKGRYKVNVSYPKNRNQNNSLWFYVECPGYTFQCSLLGITIDSCYIKGDYFIAYFRGLELKQTKTFNISKDLLYTIQGTENSWVHSLPKGATITEENDRYLLKFLNLDNRIKSINIESKDCDRVRYPATTDTSYCGEMPRCLADFDCALDEFCNKDIEKCEILNCTICQYTVNHKCIPKCKDDNTCTEDICDEGKCTYKPIEECCFLDEDCKDFFSCTEDSCSNNRCLHKAVECVASDDPCIIGVCEEPKGCRYVSNPECKGGVATDVGSLFRKIISWFKSILP